MKVAHITVFILYPYKMKNHKTERPCQQIHISHANPFGIYTAAKKMHLPKHACCLSPPSVTTIPAKKTPSR